MITQEIYDDIQQFLRAIPNKIIGATLRSKFNKRDGRCYSNSCGYCVIGSLMREVLHDNRMPAEYFAKNEFYLLPLDSWTTDEIVQAERGMQMLMWLNDGGFLQTKEGVYNALRNSPDAS